MFRLPSSRAERPPRAPAVYVVAGYAVRAGVPARFRLPLPPCWDDRAPGAWAGERRAKKAYWAALDALATGRVDREALAKATRLAAEVRSVTLRDGLHQLLATFRVVQRTERAMVPPPPNPWDRLILSVPAGPTGATIDALERRYAWTVEWLRTRRFVTAKALRVEWRVTAGDDVPVARPPARPPRPAPQTAPQPAPSAPPTAASPAA